jgi:hypothetical protein
MSTNNTCDVDSRRYIVSYLICSEDELPVDFPIPASEKGFRIGVFLPRDDPDWFGLSKYPPRILLLDRDAVVVLTHPRHNEAPIRISLSDLAFYEVGHVLLIGWLRFVAAHFQIELPYNTRSERPLTEFFDLLTETFLSDDAECRTGEISAFGPSLDIKFRNHLLGALRKDERLCARWFSPPFEVSRRWGPFRVHSKVAGDLVALTNKRVLWITDRWDGHYERYGSVTTTAPLRGIVGAHCPRTRDKHDLRILFRSGNSWSIPLSPEGSEEAEAFAEYCAAYECQRMPTCR